MNTKLTQRDFDIAAAAWTDFIDSASPEKLQALFQFATPNQSQQSIHYQTFASFELATTIPQLLSTVGIRQVMARFVLLPKDTPAGTPRFRIVLYAADERGGRISAYYQGDSDYHVIPPPPIETTDLQDLAAPQGQVPFSLISNWLNAWVTASKTRQLNQAQFATSYGPLQGYDFELSDFMDQLFVTTDTVHARIATQLRLNFGLKTYFPAYPEALTTPVQTFGLVVRLFWNSKDWDSTGSVYQGGSSYDMSAPFPPG